jgi:hypothetical protein
MRKYAVRKYRKFLHFDQTVKQVLQLVEWTDEHDLNAITRMKVNSVLVFGDIMVTRTE